MVYIGMGKWQQLNSLLINNNIKCIVILFVQRTIRIQMQLILKKAYYDKKKAHTHIHI